MTSAYIGPVCPPPPSVSVSICEQSQHLKDDFLGTVDLVPDSKCSKTYEISMFPIQCIYGWNLPGRTSQLDKCHQNVCTQGLLTRSVFIEIAWGLLRLVRNSHGKDYIGKYQ